MIRAKKDHRVSIKVQRLMECLDELGLTIDFSGFNTIITDEGTGEEWLLKDSGSGDEVSSLPYEQEYMLIKRE